MDANERWAREGQAWRTEPEIPRERQKDLLRSLETVPDAIQGKYPFSSERLTRADLEWLLATPERTLSPTEYSVEAPRTIAIHEPGSGMSLRGMFSPKEEEGEGHYSWLESGRQRSEALDIRGADISMQDLSGLPLRYIRAGMWEFVAGQSERWDSDMLMAASTNFEGCDLSNTDLYGSVLVGARFNSVRANNTSFRTADMRLLQAQHGRFVSCGFERSNLSHANFSSSIAYRCAFSGARLGGVRFGGGQFERCHFEAADFVHAYNGYVFRAAPAELAKADFTESRFEASRLGDQTFGCDCTGVLLGRASFAGADLRHTNFKNVDLCECDMAGADLREASFEGATFGSFEKESSLRLIGQAPITERASMEESIRAFELLERGEPIPEGLGEDRARLKDVRMWEAEFPDHLGPADLRGCYFFPSTRIENVELSSEGETVLVEGIHWDEVDLSSIDWSSVRVLGDEQALIGTVEKRGYERRLLTTQYAEDGSNDEQETRRRRETREYRYWKELIEAALRANRQVATALRDRGLNEAADHFSYRARCLQRRLYLHAREWLKAGGSFLLWSLAGYGFRPLRIFGAYLVVVIMFSAAFVSFGNLDVADGVVASAYAFHGRGLVSQLPSGNSILLLSAAEGVIGLFIDAILIATFAQRFLGR